MQKLISLSCCLLVFSQARGQADSATILQPVEVVAEKTSKASRASSLLEVDSLFHAQNAGAMLSELLGLRAGLFFRSYSPGGLSTATMRGSGASHATVLWNGFNLQNPMNGVTDFALFPAWLADRVGLQRGGGSSLAGSGSVGGTVFLSDQLPGSIGLTLRAGASAGSFGNLQQFASLGFRKEKWGSQGKFFHQTADNNFVIPGANGRRQIHASLRQWALSQHNELKINEKQSLGSFIWWQQAGRDIPPSLTESNSLARQEDQLARFGLSWTRTGRNSISKARAGYFLDEILYFSQVTDSSRSVSNTVSAEIEHDLLLKNGNQTLRAGLQFHRQSAVTRETGARERTRAVLLTAWERRWFSGRLLSVADLRQEIVDGRFIPLVFSSGLEAPLSNSARVYVRFNKTYNLPTFNDLYWQASQARGNPDLKPETAAGGQLGLRLARKLRGGHLSSSAELFSNLVENWIQWSPVNSAWTPMNRRSVWARGMEADLALRKRLNPNGLETNCSLSAAFVRSTVRRIYQGETAGLLNRQLIYTPEFTAAANLGLGFKGYSLFLSHHFTGLRHTTSDNARPAALPAYGVTGLAASHSWQLQRLVFDLRLHVFNLLNAAYQPMAARPAPGRHFRVEFQAAFAKI